MKNNFNRIARFYDPLSKLIFGKSLQQSQTVLLDHLQEGDRLLIVGGGTGWILEEIYNRYKNISIDYVELSENMIANAKQQSSNFSASINFIQADIRQLNTENTYDCVAAFYFFDLFELASLHQIIPALRRALKPNGKLLVADFELLSHAKWWQKIVMKTMYLFFKITTRIEASSAVPFREELRKENLKPVFKSSSLQGFLSSEVYQK